MPQSLTPIDWITVIIYAALLCGIAIYHSRQMKAQDDVFLAGRSMSRWPIALSMYMALFSTNTFLGVLGWLNRPDGTIWIGLQNVGIVLAVPFVILLYPSLFFRLRISTAYEYLEKRFNYAVRALAAVFFLGARIMWMSTMLYGMGLVISMMLGWTREQGVAHGQIRAIVVVGVLGTFFGFAGGMRAVIWTDAVQFFVMMGSVVMMAIFAVSRCGGVTSVLSIAADAGKFEPPAAFSLTDDLSIVSGLLLGFIAMLSSCGSDQVVLQTYLTARSEEEAKRSLRRNGFLLKPMSLIFPVLGVIMFAYYHAHPDVAARMRVPDDALPVFVLSVLPSGLRGLLAVAIVAAVLTSLDSGMTAMSATVQVDFVRRWMKRPLSDRGAVLMGRMLILAWGVVIIAAALWVRTLGARHNIIQILNIVMYPFSGVLLGIFLLGIVTRRANASGVLIGAAAGFVTTIGVPLSRVILDILARAGIELPAGLADRVGQLSGVSNFYYGALGTFATILLGYLASLFFARPAAAKIEGLTRRNLPNPPVETRSQSMLS